MGDVNGSISPTFVPTPQGGGTQGAAPVDPNMQLLYAAQTQLEQLQRQLASADSPQVIARTRQAIAQVQSRISQISQQIASDQAGGNVPNGESIPTWLEAFSMMMGGSQSFGSGGSSSSGGTSAADLERMRQGYQQMLAALDKQSTTTNGIFDQRNTQLGSLRSAGDARLQEILGTLRSNAASTRQNVAGAYGAADQALQGQASQFQAMDAARQAGAGRTLEAFGADPNMTQRGMSPLDVIAAQRATLGSQAGTSDAMYANRDNVYGGLSSDVSTRNSQSFDALMARLASERAAWQAQQDAERAKVLVAAGQQGVAL